MFGIGYDSNEKNRDINIPFLFYTIINDVADNYTVI